MTAAFRRSPKDQTESTRGDQCVEEERLIESISQSVSDLVNQSLGSTVRSKRKTGLIRL